MLRPSARRGAGGAAAAGRAWSGSSGPVTLGGPSSGPPGPTCPPALAIPSPSLIPDAAGTASSASELASPGLPSSRPAWNHSGPASRWRSSSPDAACTGAGPGGVPAVRARSPAACSMSKLELLSSLGYWYASQQARRGLPGAARRAVRGCRRCAAAVRRLLLAVAEAVLRRPAALGSPPRGASSRSSGFAHGCCAGRLLPAVLRCAGCSLAQPTCVGCPDPCPTPLTRTISWAR